MEQSQLRELRREAVRMKRRIDNAVAMALACELEGEWAPAADEADTLLGGKPISIAEAAGTVEALRALYGPLAERLEAGLRALDGDEMTPTGAEDGTHILITTELQFDKSNMYPASQGRRSGSVENPDLTRDSLLPLELVKKACAEIGEYGFKPKSWSRPPPKSAAGSVFRSMPGEKRATRWAGITPRSRWRSSSSGSSRLGALAAISGP